MEQKKEGRLTYAQLNEACGQLFNENRGLRKRLAEAEAALGMRRIECLFKVIGQGEAFGEGVRHRCAEEIEAALFGGGEDGKGGEHGTAGAKEAQ